VNRLRATLAGLFIALVIIGLSQSPARAASRGLWGHNYVATRVTGDGARGKLFSRPEIIDVSFTWAPRLGKWISFQAACNSMGGHVRVHGGKLHIGGITTSEVFCPGLRNHQDNWLWTFFESDPNWRLRGRRLTIWGGGRSVILRQHPRLK
jgi:heat shock protein HslJ